MLKLSRKQIKYPLSRYVKGDDKNISGLEVNGPEFKLQPCHSLALKACFL
jgi:hypothetical protein